jgi:hypothetical protein
MAGLDDAAPWATYSRTKGLGPGWTHPLGQQEVRRALKAVSLRVGELRLADAAGTAWRAREPVRLVSARRIGDDAFRHYGWPQERQTEVTVYACPSAVRQELRQPVMDALARVLSWLASTPLRGEGWAAVEHEVEALWLHPGLRVMEDRFRR